MHCLLVSLGITLPILITECNHLILPLAYIIGHVESVLLCSFFDKRTRALVVLDGTGEVARIYRHEIVVADGIAVSYTHLTWFRSRRISHRDCRDLI